MSEELKRSDDRLIGQLIQKLEDQEEQTKEWRDRHDRESKDWRDATDKRMQMVEDFVKNFKWSYRFFIGVIAACSAILALIVKFVTYFKLRG